MILAFCGPGRAGKDTAAAYWAKITGLRFNGGCSYTVLGPISKALGLSADEAYLRRHEDRDFWYRWCNSYRADDPARIVRESLRHSDIICGIRDKCELLAAIDERLIDLAVWIYRDVPPDPTIMFTAQDCDVSISNHSTLEKFRWKLRRLNIAMTPRRAWSNGEVEKRYQLAADLHGFNTG